MSEKCILENVNKILIGQFLSNNDQTEDMKRVLKELQDKHKVIRKIKDDLVNDKVKNNNGSFLSYKGSIYKNKDDQGSSNITLAIPPICVLIL